MHFASRGATSVPGVEFVCAEVTPGDRFATIRLLRELRVNYVLVPSPTPETFCFVAHEALIAGARILCMEGSGYVPVLVEDTGRGRVFANEAALSEFFVSGEAVHDLDKDDDPQVGYEIAQSGTTACLILQTSEIASDAIRIEADAKNLCL